MSWLWDQSAGTMSHNGVVVGRGYSGAGTSKNDPSSQSKPAAGPIPRGKWEMVGVESGGPTGPFTIILKPLPGTDTCGRSAFRIHGDSSSHPGDASHGCIILPRPVREHIWQSGDRELEVVA